VGDPLARARAPHARTHARMHAFETPVLAACLSVAAARKTQLQTPRAPLRQIGAAEYIAAIQREAQARPLPAIAGVLH
jgi:hypothetical protein